MYTRVRKRIPRFVPQLIKSSFSNHYHLLIHMMCLAFSVSLFPRNWSSYSVGDFYANIAQLVNVLVYPFTSYISCNITQEIVLVLPLFLSITFAVMIPRTVIPIMGPNRISTPGSITSSPSRSTNKSSRTR